MNKGNENSANLYFLRFDMGSPFESLYLKKIAHCAISIIILNALLYIVFLK